MILGPLEARFLRAFNEPNHIDFLSLNPEKIAREVNTVPFVTDPTEYLEICLIKKKHNYIYE